VNLCKLILELRSDLIVVTCSGNRGLLKKDSKYNTESSEGKLNRQVSNNNNYSRGSSAST